MGDRHWVFNFITHYILFFIPFVSHSGRVASGMWNFQFYRRQLNANKPFELSDTDNRVSPCWGKTIVIAWKSLFFTFWHVTATTKEPRIRLKLIHFMAEKWLGQKKGAWTKRPRALYCVINLCSDQSSAVHYSLAIKFHGFLIGLRKLSQIFLKVFNQLSHNHFPFFFKCYLISASSQRLTIFLP